MPNVDVISVHHVCLVVQDREAADAFYIGVLGFQPHHKVKSWLVLNGASTLHLVAIPGTAQGMRPRTVLFSISPCRSPSLGTYSKSSCKQDRSHSRWMAG